MKCLLILCATTCAASELTDYQLFNPPTASVTYQALMAKDFTVNNTFTGQYNLSSSFVKVQADFLSVTRTVENESFSATYNLLHRFDFGFLGAGIGPNYLHKRYGDNDSQANGQVNAFIGLESHYTYFLADTEYLTNGSYFFDFSVGFHTGDSGYVGLIQHWEHVNPDSPANYSQSYKNSQTGLQYVYSGSTMDWSLELNTKAFMWALGVKF